MSIDSIGNFLTIIRNGLRASKPFIVAPHSKIKAAIAAILKNEGFIKDFIIINEENSNKKSIKIVFKYVDGESVIHEITRISTPGRRTYENADRLKPVIGKLGISILTTNKGIITSKQAKDLSVGGEVICSVW